MITSSSTATTIIIGCMEHFLCTRHCVKEIHAHSGDVGQPYDLPGPTECNRSDAVPVSSPASGGCSLDQLLLCEQTGANLLEEETRQRGDDCPRPAYSLQLLN